MKKIYYSLLYLATVAMLAACANNEENLFGSSSSDRMDAAIAASKEILTSEENGWLMEYYPEAHQSFGGYSVLMKFSKDGKVSIASELYSPTKVATSLYDIKQSAGVVLSLNTYNEVFHLFADPSDPTGLGGFGYGLEGDYDFQIVEAVQEKVVLRGKKSGGLAVLRPFKGSWSDYITMIQAADDLMLFSDFTLEMDGQTIPAKGSYRTLIFTYKENGNEVSKTASYVVTKTGYKFYEPVVINGKTLTGFIFHAADDSFTEVNDANIKLLPVIQPLNSQFVAGNWFVAYSKLGSFAQPYFYHCKGRLDSLGETLFYVYMGSNSNGDFGLNFNSDSNLGMMGYNYTLVGKNKITFKFSFTGSGRGLFYYQNVDFYKLLIPFSYNVSRTFTLTTDRPAKPSYMTLTEDANPDNVITLSASRISYPFDN